MKEEPAQSKEPKFLAKAGWVKKAQGRLLASYKERYVHVEKTEIVVYEDEVRYHFCHLDATLQLLICVVQLQCYCISESVCVVIVVGLFNLTNILKR